MTPHQRWKLLVVFRALRINKWKREIRGGDYDSEVKKGQHDEQISSDRRSHSCGGTGAGSPQWGSHRGISHSAGPAGTPLRHVEQEERKKTRRDMIIGLLGGSALFCLTLLIVQVMTASPFIPAFYLVMAPSGAIFGLACVISAGDQFNPWRDSK